MGQGALSRGLGQGSDLRPQLLFLSSEEAVPREGRGVLLFAEHMACQQAVGPPSQTIKPVILTPCLISFPNLPLGVQNGAAGKASLEEAATDYNKEDTAEPQPGYPQQMVLASHNGPAFKQMFLASHNGPAFKQMVLGSHNGPAFQNATSNCKLESHFGSNLSFLNRSF